MKPFEEVKIVAAFAAHNDDRWIDQCLADLSRYTDEIYVNLNDATPYVANAVKSHPNVKKWVETTKNGRQFGMLEQGVARETALRLVDESKPDIVLFPDSDETYPNNTIEQLRVFWENDEYETFWFRLLYLHGDPDHFRNDGLYKSIHHVRIFKWTPETTFIPYLGYACPTNYINTKKKYRYNSTAPTLHWGYMYDDDRKRKFSRDGHIDHNDLLLREVPEDLKYH